MTTIRHTRCFKILFVVIPKYGKRCLNSYYSKNADELTYVMPKTGPINANPDQSWRPSYLAQYQSLQLNWSFHNQYQLQSYRVCVNVQAAAEWSRDRGVILLEGQKEGKDMGFYQHRLPTQSTLAGEVCLYLCSRNICSVVIAGQSKASLSDPGRL